MRDVVVRPILASSLHERGQVDLSDIIEAYLTVTGHGYCITKNILQNGQYVVHSSVKKPLKLRKSWSTFSCRTVLPMYCNQIMGGNM